VDLNIVLECQFLPIMARCATLLAGTNNTLQPYPTYEELISNKAWKFPDLLFVYFFSFTKSNVFKEHHQNQEIIQANSQAQPF